MSGGLDELVPYWSYGVQFIEATHDRVGAVFIAVRDGIKYHFSRELLSTLRMASVLIVTGVIAIKALGKVYVD
jgi:hypothetical protein